MTTCGWSAGGVVVVGLGLEVGITRSPQAI
jgi:hypothetical protein